MASSASGTWRCSTVRMASESGVGYGDALPRITPIHSSSHSRLDPGQRGAHLGLDLVLVVAGQHAAVDAELDPRRDTRSRRRCWTARWSARRRSRRAARSCRRARGRAPRARRARARAGAGSRRRARRSGSSTRSSTSSRDDSSMTTGSSCATSASTICAAADHGVAAAQRHRGVPGLAVHDEAELRRALLAALEQIHAPGGVLEEVRRRPR